MFIQSAESWSHSKAWPSLLLAVTGASQSCWCYVQFLLRFLWSVSWIRNCVGSWNLDQKNPADVLHLLCVLLKFRLLTLKTHQILGFHWERFWLLTETLHNKPHFLTKPSQNQQDGSGASELNWYFLYNKHRSGNSATRSASGSKRGPGSTSVDKTDLNVSGSKRKLTQFWTLRDEN